MRPFSPTRLDGTLRYRPPSVVKAKPSRQASKRANGVLTANGNSATGRRLKELLKAYAGGFPTPLDEQTAGLIRSAAAIAMEVEKLEDSAARGESVNHFAMARLINTRTRVLRRLDELREKQHASSSGSTEGSVEEVEDLHHLLRKIAWAKKTAGVSSWGDIPEARREELKLEFDRREREGTLAADAK